MSGEEADERKANALKQSLDYLDMFLEETPYVAAPHLTIADFSLLASVTQLEGMEYKINAYPWVLRSPDQLAVDPLDFHNTSWLILFIFSSYFVRNLYKWVERLKSELPYYESCNTGEISDLSSDIYFSLRDNSDNIKLSSWNWNV